MKEEQSPYLRLIQKTGFTRHPGGLDATDIMLSRTSLHKKSHLLDVGCGAGHTMAHVAKNYGCKVTGLDISSEALAKAQSYQKEPFFSSLDFVQGSILSLPFADNSFDVVLCESVLVFIEDKDQALKELSRVCKPHGFLAINELCANNESEIKDYFGRPEMGAFLCSAETLKQPLEKDFSIILYDERAFSFMEQLSVIKNYGNMHGALLLLEGFHHILTDQETRNDFLKVLKLSMSLPKNAFNSLSWLLLLMRKN